MADLAHGTLRCAEFANVSECSIVAEPAQILRFGEADRRTKCFARNMRARLPVVLLALAGAVEMALAVQIVEQGSPEPSGRLFVAGWLEMELWVDVPLFVAGLASLVAAISLLWLRRTRVRGE
jgi:hypothetical protein